MPKVIILLGTRPEIIRLSRVIDVLDQTCDQVLVHTGQNYDDRLSGMFFRELDVREPDVFMGVRGCGFADQIGQMLARTEELFVAEKPDTVLILGDTNPKCMDLEGLACFLETRIPDGVGAAYLGA